MTDTPYAGIDYRKFMALLFSRQVEQETVMATHFGTPYVTHHTYVQTNTPFFTRFIPDIDDPWTIMAPDDEHAPPGWALDYHTKKKIYARDQYLLVYVPEEGETLPWPTLLDCDIKWIDYVLAKTALDFDFFAVYSEKYNGRVKQVMFKGPEDMLLFKAYVNSLGDPI